MASIFQQYIAQNSSLYGGAPIGVQPDLNITGLPGFNGNMGMMMQMALQPILQQFIGSSHLPAQFFQQHNIYDQARMRSQVAIQQAAIRDGAQADNASVVSMLRGISNSAGLTWNASRQGAAERVAKDWNTYAGPMLAMTMPDLYGALMPGGSQAVMRSQMYLGGRFAIDPVSGRMMHSADTTRALSEGLYKSFYGGTKGDMGAARGLRADQIGALYNELQGRGLGVSSASREDMMRGMAAKDVASGKSTDISSALEALNKLGSPQLERRLREFESGRISERIKNMVGAVSAMRDIFGDMGKVGSMSELIEGVQLITQGGISTMSKARLASTVRQAGLIARDLGEGGMDKMTMLLAGAGRMTDRLGLDRALAPMIAFEGALFGRAYGDAVGDRPVFGAMGPTKANLTRQQLTANMMGSGVGNLIAATSRIGRNIGFKAGTEAEAMFKALSLGQDTWKHKGKEYNLTDSVERWLDIMKAGGIDNVTAQSIRISNVHNQEQFHVNPLLKEAGMRAQAKEQAIAMAQAYARGFEGQKFGDAESKAMGEALAQGIRTMDPNLLNDSKALAALVEADWRKRGIKPSAGMLERLRKGVEVGEGNLTELNRKAGFEGAGINLKDLINEKTAQRKRDRQEDLKLEERMQERLSKFGDVPWQRISKALAGAKKGTKLTEVLADILGWTKEDDILPQFEAELKTLRDESIKLSKRGGSKEDIAARDEAERRLLEMMPRLHERVKDQARIKKAGGWWNSLTDAGEYGPQLGPQKDSWWDSLSKFNPWQGIQGDEKGGGKNVVAKGGKENITIGGRLTIVWPNEADLNGNGKRGVDV